MRARVVIGDRQGLPQRSPLHLTYHQFNLSRGRLPGQLRLRSRWRDLATPWFDYLFVSIGQLEELALGTGWELMTYQSGPASYLAIFRLS